MVGSDIVVPFLLLRTKEILEDGSVIITNEEQENYHFNVRITCFFNSKKVTFTVTPQNASNKEFLHYRLFLKRILAGEQVTVNALSLNEKLMCGTSPFLADTDGDGLLDGEEFAHTPPLDPLTADSDGDGYLDGEEAVWGMNPLSPDGGAGTTIRYVYDEDDRLAAVCSGAEGTASVSAFSPAGNPTRQSVH